MINPCITSRVRDRAINLARSDSSFDRMTNISRTVRREMGIEVGPLVTIPVQLDRELLRHAQTQIYRSIYERWF